VSYCDDDPADCMNPDHDHREAFEVFESDELGDDEEDEDDMDTNKEVLGQDNRTSTRWFFQTNRDERLFEAAWFADFRNQFRSALQDARIAGRLNALEVA
jgi:hypothetical protein